MPFEQLSRLFTTYICAFSSLWIRKIRREDCAKSKFAYLHKPVLIYSKCVTIQERCRRKSARVIVPPGRFSDINSDVSTRYKSPNDAQSFLPLEGVTFHSASNESIPDTGIFSWETENEIINKSISHRIQRRQMQRDAFKQANEYQNRSGLSLKY